ncbi:hypothetical protein DEIGR_400032 [Deinococcus grandis]|uniref:Uncharacterized protein n=1 Tax=Deinococcus grandis TaxID=57498 RepID=A0A100HQN8_9DEIO|nr:hypothetical protein [Deinococcus grandis]GAQ23899.1 hypothetical protein DEIGR_400032 [Deinococcus grandis]
MATKKDNAALLGEKLGVTINADASNPKADVLQGWADRADTDPEGVKREILTAQVEAALDVELTDATLTVDTLAGILAQASEDQDAARAALQQALDGPPASAAGAGSQGDPDPAPTEPAGETVTVRVNDIIAEYGGTFTDPEQPEGQRVITGDAREVQRTHTVRQGLLTGTLVEA